MNVTRIPMLATSLCLTLLGTIALAQSVTYERDRSARFSTYETYAWTRGTELTDERAHARVVRAIDAALAAKGLEWVEPGASPRVLVAYHASFDENLEISGSVRRDRVVPAVMRAGCRAFSRFRSERSSPKSPRHGQVPSYGGAVRAVM